MLAPRFVAAVVVLLTAVSAHAWNPPGHQVIDLIAWAQLDDDDRERAVSLLREHPRFEQHFLERMPRNVWRGSEAEQDQWVFAHAGTWADLVRSKSDVVTRDDVMRFSRGSWHYINLPIFPTAADRAALEDDLPADRATEPPDDRRDPRMNVIQAIKHAQRVLHDANEPRPSRAVALCWLLHLVADAHQPCHAASLCTVAQFPSGDRGATQIPVRGRPDNLHAVWDQSIVARARYNDIRTTALKLADQHAETGAAAIATTDPKAWIVESFRLARPTVYTPIVLDAVAAAEDGDIESIELPPEYLEDASVASRIRAVEAGYRIAELLRGQ